MHCDSGAAIDADRERMQSAHRIRRDDGVELSLLRTS